MVIIKIQFGMGNQLFMYAAARCQAHKLNTELKIDKSYYEKENLTDIAKYRLSEFNIPDNFATAEDIKNLGPNDIYIDRGLFQKDIFFKEIDDIIRQEFTLRNPVSEKTAYWRDKISSAECPVALHIRRGDYYEFLYFRIIFGVLPLEYYHEAVNRLKSGGENLTIFVFSDDLKWARENLNFGDVKMEFVEGIERDYEEIYLMSLCRHNIIANSTFSWWGAWLNNNPNKKVFAPTPWFRKAIISGSPDGIIPDEWIKIPVNFEHKPDFEAPPLLSIILYVKDDVRLTLSSILSQNLREYEIIVVDASTNSSGEFCRQFVGRENISFVKADASIGKAAAWNKGLALARGDYITFFSGDEFILPHTVHLLFQIWNYYREKFEKEHAFSVDYFAYKPNAPNIICATQRISEDAAGTLGIEGFPDRKFAIQTDAPFQNLNAITELKIDSAQKLILLATNQLNTLLGTKFFKRAFLVENKIRFDENFGADTELMFLISVFMHTEKITFVPQLFYGRLN